jgi:hypothetical protein
MAAVALNLMVARTAPAAEISDPAKAEELIREANELRRSHQDAKALPLFREAYEISRTPRSAAQLGLAELALGYWDAANGHLTEALTQGRNPWVEKNRRILEASQKDARSHLAPLTVQGTPSGAEVVLNRHVVGTLPLPGPVLVNEGQIEVEVRASAYRPDRRVITVAGAVATQITVNLEHETAAPAVTETQQPPPRVQRVQKAEALPAEPIEDKPKVREIAPPAASEELPTWRKVVPWSLAGAALVAGGVGLWQQLKSADALDEFNGIETCGKGEVNRGGGRCPGLYNDFATAQTRARASYVIAGVLGASAIGVFIWNAGSSSANVALAPGEFRLSLRGSF